MDMEEYLRERRRLVDDALERHLPRDDTYPEEIHKAVRYSVFSGGKRLRPILTLAATEAVGGDEQTAIPFACAIEIIHTYSLIHDDLPAMDDDDLRRGKPTSHKVFGEAIAILAGDALNTEAFNLIARETLEKGINPVLALEIITEITDAAGLKGMVTGQVLDLEKEDQPCRPEELEFIHRHKTASLITASVRVGARLGGAGPSELEALTNYGMAIGLAFQIVDDLLDVEGGKEWGKVRGRDKNLSKATYPALHGLEASRSKARELSEKACAAIDGFDHRADPLRSLAEYIVSRTY